MEQREDFLGKEGARQRLGLRPAGGTYLLVVAIDEPAGCALRQAKKAELIALLTCDSL